MLHVLTAAPTDNGPVCGAFGDLSSKLLTLFFLRIPHSCSRYPSLLRGFSVFLLFMSYFFYRFSCSCSFYSFASSSTRQSQKKRDDRRGRSPKILWGSIRKFDCIFQCICCIWETSARGKCVDSLHVKLHKNQVEHFEKIWNHLPSTQYS